MLLPTSNIHFVSGKGGKGLEQGLSCKANSLARVLNQNLNKQRKKARNGKIRGESASQIEMASQLARLFGFFLDIHPWCPIKAFLKPDKVGVQVEVLVVEGLLGVWGAWRGDLVVSHFSK